MLGRIRKRLPGAGMPVLLAALAAMSVATPLFASKRQPASLADKVRHELVMLPYYGVFDNLAFEIESGNAVVLTGQVTKPVLKSDAENVVRRIEGVTSVVNNIEVLPLSSMDDSIRWATYRAIFSRPGFERYADQALSPIRIIVKNGNITLEGVVASQLDKTVAEMAARSVPFTFGVTNKLTIA